MNNKANGKPIDFGYYINADEITKELRNGGFSFSAFRIQANQYKLEAFAINSGLINPGFTKQQFKRSYTIQRNSVELVLQKYANRVGQIIARFLREEMLRLKRRFSFETVFSHKSNLIIMRTAAEMGYKVYLYFVSTESPEINKYRVKLRVKENGHDVPPGKITGRYYRSLELLSDAAAIAYQAFFFDNSRDNEPFRLVAHFKKQGTELAWDKIPKQDRSNWFKKYYIAKAG